MPCRLTSTVVPRVPPRGSTHWSMCCGSPPAVAASSTAKRIRRGILSADQTVYNFPAAHDVDGPATRREQTIFGVDPKLVIDGGETVFHRHRVAIRLAGRCVRCAINLPLGDAAARQHLRVNASPMVASRVVVDLRRSAELARYGHQP